MGIELLTERHREQIAGVLSCFDRIIIQGTLPGLCFADGMTRYLNLKGIRIFDYPRFAEPFRAQLRENAGSLSGGQRTDDRLHPENQELQEREKDPADPRKTGPACRV